MRVVLDSRRGHLPPDDYDRVYAPGTRQNRTVPTGPPLPLLADPPLGHAHARGRRHPLQVEAADTRGNLTRTVVPFTLQNP